jgi:hypothetical protein
MNSRRLTGFSRAEKAADKKPSTIFEQATALCSSVKRDVRFTPKSGHCRTTAGCPLCAKSRREQLQQISGVIRSPRRHGRALKAEL